MENIKTLHIEMVSSRRPRLEIDLSGPDGNIFAVLSKAKKLLGADDWNTIWERVRKTENYYDALNAIDEYVEVVEKENPRR